MNKKNQAVILYFNAWLPPLLWVILIFFLSSQSVLPKFETSAIDFFFKKLAHMTVYAILYLLIFRAVSITNRFCLLAHKQYISLALCLVYAISDEIHQSFVPGRFATLRDIGYDLLGMTTAFLRQAKYI